MPLSDLVKQRVGVYGMTCAAIKRAVQINLAGDDELADSKGKIVSLALRQILTDKVQYSLED
jgi:DNA-directed RNA polymerase subunit omega